jgi:uncharacterized protein
MRHNLAIWIPFSGSRLTKSCLIFFHKMGFRKMVTMSQSSYETEIGHWRQMMDDKLRAEDGWLSLTGLYWLHPGDNTVGVNPTADIVLPSGQTPDDLGLIELANDQIILRVTAAVPVTVDGEPRMTAVLRHDHEAGGPSRVQIGSITFFIIQRGSEYGVRVRDMNNPARLEFRGRNWFPLDQDYRVEGKFVPHEEARVLQVVTSSGHINPITNHGTVEFVLHNQHLSLQAFAAGENEVWLVFKDNTSGKSTYGGGRFLYAPLTEEGIVKLDFNKAYHPPCAYTPFATCPLPPKENWLPLDIPAGERL